MIIILFLSFLISFLLPVTDFSVQEKLHSSLLQLSSIILAITGAWAAIVYPDALQHIIKKDQSKEKITEIDNLIKPMSVSLVILGILILIQLITFILGVLKDPNKEMISIAKQINLGILIFLYLLQIYSIILAFIPISDAKRKAALEQKLNDLLDLIDRK